MSDERKLKALIVDDEPVQLESIARGLFLYGYEMVGAASGAEAMAALSGPDGDRFDLLITDLTMPGTSGAQLVDQVRAARPGFPVIVITGLTSSHDVDALRAEGIPILQKPFSPDQLDAAIRALLPT